MVRCNIPMVERPRRDVSDGSSWWCRQCKTRKSIRAGSFFSKSKLTLQKWLLLIQLWAWEFPVTSAVELVEHTAVDNLPVVERSLLSQFASDRGCVRWARGHCPISIST